MAIYHFFEVWRLLQAARQFDALVLCTTGIEAIVVARLKRLICPRRLRLVVFDLLIPRKEGSLMRWVGAGLAHADAVAVIRRGDARTLIQRYGVRDDRCQFVPFPAPANVTAVGAPELDYIYSAGWAHRDWPTLLAALAGLQYRAILCPGRPIEVPLEARERVEVRPMPTPEEGRRLMAGARIVVLALVDTELPSGPLVLLDAMAMGKAIVVTDVNGSRDYVTDAVDALVVKAGDAEALAIQIGRAMEDESLRHRVGTAAAARTALLSAELTTRELVRLAVGERNAHSELSV